MDQESLPEEGRVPSQAPLNLLFPDQRRRTEASDMRAVSPAAPVLKVGAEEQDPGTPLAEEVCILTLASPMAVQLRRRSSIANRAWMNCYS